jgi:hypothetical protein
VAESLVGHSKALTYVKRAYHQQEPVADVYSCSGALQMIQESLFRVMVSVKDQPLIGLEFRSVVLLQHFKRTGMSLPQMREIFKTHHIVDLLIQQF